MAGVFITGASSGIGEALARHYAGSASVLGLAARRKDHLDALASNLKVPCATYALDVSDAEANVRVAGDFIQRFGSPDLVIANAGISVGTHGDDPADVAKLRRVLDVNVVGLAATLAAFAPSMRAAKRGTLCGIASVAGIRDFRARVPTARPRLPRSRGSRRCAWSCAGAAWRSSRSVPAISTRR